MVSIPGEALRVGSRLFVERIQSIPEIRAGNRNAQFCHLTSRRRVMTIWPGLVNVATSNTSYPGLK